MKGYGSMDNFKPAFPSLITLATIGMFGAAMTGSLFSADAWNSITFTAGEVKNPKRNLWHQEAPFCFDGHFTLP